MLELADYYGIIPLKDLCGMNREMTRIVSHSLGTFLGQHIDEENVFGLLEVVEKYSCNNLRQLCAAYLAQHFGKFTESGKLSELEISTVVDMLESDDLSVRQEEEVYESVMKYVEKWKDDERQQIDVLQELLPGIRWLFLSSKFLVEVIENHPLLRKVPIMHQLLFEGTKAYLVGRISKSFFSLHLVYRHRTYPALSSGKLRTTPRKGNCLSGTANN